MLHRSSKQAWAWAMVISLAGCPSSAPSPDPEVSSAKAEPPTRAASPAPRQPPDDGIRSIDFEGLPARAPAAAFELAETNGHRTPALWWVAKLPDAPSGEQVFGVAATNNKGQTYNVALLEGSSLANGAVAVSILPQSGKQDQGGGIVLRARDADNYYVARWNPLEDNVRLYVVEGSHRTALGRADIELDPEQWHRLKVLVAGDRFEILVDDDSVLIVYDTTFASAGMVGLWTKADAATWFDDLTIEPDA